MAHKEVEQLENEEQRIMERRYVLPYNWAIKPEQRKWRRKQGEWEIAQLLAGEVKGKDILDAGCGDGWYTARMVAVGARATGVDYSGKAISFARIIVDGASFFDASLTKLPFRDASFDIIFSFQVIEHIPPQELPRAILELQRVLRSGGLLIVGVPSVKRPFSKAHFQHFTEASLREVVESGGFKMIQAVGQERHDVFLWFIEHLLQNRYWHLTALSSFFHRSIYRRFWLRTSSSKGYNIIGSFTK